MPLQPGQHLWWHYHRSTRTPGAAGGRWPCPRGGGGDPAHRTPRDALGHLASASGNATPDGAGMYQSAGFGEPEFSLDEAAPAEAG